MTKQEQNKLIWTLKYGHYLPYRLDIDLTSINENDRVVSSEHYPNGIYANMAEKIETELNIPIELWCEQTGIKLEECL